MYLGPPLLCFSKSPGHGTLLSLREPQALEKNLSGKNTGANVACLSISSRSTVKTLSNFAGDSTSDMPSAKMHVLISVLLSNKELTISIVITIPMPT